MRFFRSFPAFLSALASSYKGYQRLSRRHSLRICSSCNIKNPLWAQMLRLNAASTAIPWQWTRHIPVPCKIGFRAICLEEEPPHLFTIWLRMNNRVLDTLCLLVLEVTGGKNCIRNFMERRASETTASYSHKSLYDPLEAVFFPFEGQRNMAIRINRSDSIEEATKVLPWPLPLPLPPLTQTVGPPLTCWVALPIYIKSLKENPAIALSFLSFLKVNFQTSLSILWKR